MKQGDLIRYKNPDLFWNKSKRKVYLVRRSEPENNWVFVYGFQVPIQMSLMEVISESR